MADLYSIIAGIQPDQQELVEAELLAKQILEAKFPTMDLREGTGVRDLVLRPSATLLAMIKKGVDYYFAQNTLASVDDVTPADIVDGILANSFITRRSGSKSTINARLFFARTKNISISSSSYFSPDNKIKYFPITSATYAATSMLYDGASNEYYIDIGMVAEKEGSSYDLSSGSLLYFSNFDPYFLRAEINYLVLTSQPTETNTVFINRAKNAVSTRNLVNPPSIDFNLRDTFNYLNSILSVGMGDPEMLRDMVKAVLPAQVARPITGMTIANGIATCTLVAHGYHTGQFLHLVGSSAVVFNDDFLITVTSADVFTIVVPGGTTVPVTLPSSRDSDAPVSVHTGGCVDIYCADSFASGIIQVLTDATGKATVTGPVVGMLRSSTSGGASADTISLLNSMSVISTSISFSADFTPGVSLCTLSTGTHPFVNGEVIQISGTVETLPISAISCAALIATVTSNGHGYSVGNTVIIAGVTPADYNGTYVITAVTTNTFTYTMLTNVLVVGAGTMTCEVNVLNGSRTIYSSTSTSISILVNNTSATTTGTAALTSPVRYTVSNPNSYSIKIYNITKDVTGNILVNIPRHSFVPGRRITLSGINVAGYNGNFQILSVTDQDNFIVSTPLMLTDVTAITISGSEQCTTMIPSKDFGFSNKQELTVDFGIGHANSTASFNIKYFQYLYDIQTYLDAQQRRILCGSYLARGYSVYALDIAVTSYTQATSTPTLAATNYIKSLSPGSPFVVGELVAHLKANGMVDIKFPISIGFTRYNRALDYFGTPDVGTITDVLDPNDRTSIFMLNSLTTNVEVLPTISVPLRR